MSISYKFELYCYMRPSVNVRSDLDAYSAFFYQCEESILFHLKYFTGRYVICFRFLVSAHSNKFLEKLLFRPLRGLQILFSLFLCVVGNGQKYLCHFLLINCIYELFSSMMTAIFNMCQVKIQIKYISPQINKTSQSF